MYSPFLMRTIVWIDGATDQGFIPHRPRAVRASLDAHHWHVDVRTKSWLSIVSDLRGAWRAYIDGEQPQH